MKIEIEVTARVDSYEQRAVHQSFARRRYHGVMANSALHTILVPVDGSAASVSALRLALRLAGWDGEIIIAHAIDKAAVVAESISPYGGDADAALDAQAAEKREILAQASGIVRAEGISYSTAPLAGSIVAGIAFLAIDRNVDAIAMGTHGLSGVAGLVHGNTAAGVMRRTSVPVFIVGPQHTDVSRDPLMTIVVALDASPAASAAARAAVDLAAVDGGQVVFAHVAAAGDVPDRTDAAARAAAYAHRAGVRSEILNLRGRPAEAIVRSAEACNGQLIAVGAHGRSDNPFGFGNIAQAIARTSPVPVLVVPAPPAPRSAPV
jgi:nucleotide-binding universal stress UspA family protein